MLTISSLSTAFPLTDDQPLKCTDLFLSVKITNSQLNPTTGMAIAQPPVSRLIRLTKDCGNSAPNKSDERIITGKLTATMCVGSNRSPLLTYSSIAVQNGGPFASTNLQCDFDTIVDDDNRPIDEKTLLEFMKGVASLDALATRPGGVTFLPILWQCCYNEIAGCFGVTEPGTSAFEEELERIFCFFDTQLALRINDLMGILG